MKNCNGPTGGEDTLQEKLQAAAVMIHELDKKQPGLKNLLRSKGIGDNALVARRLLGKANAGTPAEKGGEMPRQLLPARRAQVTRSRPMIYSVASRRAPAH